MTTVFLDTVGLVALWERADQWHEGARSSMATLNHPSVRLVTTDAVLLECGNAATRKPYRAEVARLRRTLQSDNRIFTPTNADIEQAWNAYAIGHPADAGIVDHISFTVMRRLHITDAFTNDRHFKSAGFHTLF